MIWLFGIAASLALVLMVFNYLERQTVENQFELPLVTDILQTESKVSIAGDDFDIPLEKTKENLEVSSQGKNAINSNFFWSANQVNSEKKPPSAEQDLATLPISLDSLLFDGVFNQYSKLLVIDESLQVDKQSSENEKPELKTIASPTTEVAALEALLSQIKREEDLQVIEKSRTSSFSLGFGPGFANSSQKSMESSGSTFGLGITYDITIKEKIAIGSGLGFNLYNQTNQTQYYPQLATNAQMVTLASPVNQEQKVQQVQVDFPIYVRYPLTRNNSVTLQAGFSNLLTINQDGMETVSYTIQIRDVDALSGSSTMIPGLKTEQVNQISELNRANNQFFPFAMANLGVNILVYRTQKTRFLVMPFYHYPLQDISGTGQNPGVSGAALKVNFGTTKK